jgi:protein gp37
MYRDKKRYGQDPTLVVRSHPATFNNPRRVKEPTLIFTCSWSDFFIEEADQWRPEAWEIIRATPQHTYQILTKRPERMDVNLPPGWPFPNVWLGVSVENQKMADRRIPILLQTPAVVRFISAEPLLGPIDFLPYLPYNPVYEKQTQRGVCLSGGQGRRHQDSEGWNDLEGEEKGMGPLETAGGESRLRGHEGRARLRGILPSSSDDRWQESLLSGPQTSLVTLQGSDPRTINGQSQGREEKAQPPEQLGVGGLLRTTNSCEQDSESGTRLPSGRSYELDGKTEAGASDGDTQAEARGREVGCDSGRFQRAISDNFKDRPWGQLGVDQIIAGGESGPRARPSSLEWFRSVGTQCSAAGVAFFMKQITERGRKVPFNQWPEDLRVREFPKGAQ